MATQSRLAEAHEDDPVKVRMVFQESRAFAHRDPGGAVQRESVGAGADGRKRDRPQTVLNRQSQAVAVAARQEFILAAVTAVPYRADRVNDVPRGQAVTLLDFRVESTASPAMMRSMRIERSRLAFLLARGLGLLCAVGGWFAAGGVSAAENALTGDHIPAREGELIVHPINHATLALGWKDKVIYVDPVGGAKRFAGLPKPDLILITHIHADHWDKAALKEVVTDKTALVAPPAVADQLPPNLRRQTTVLTNGQARAVMGIPIEVVAAGNLTPERLAYHPKGRDNGYVVDLGGLRVYVSGDTEDIPEMRALKNIDVAFVCMNLPYTMDAGQAARAVREFRPRIVYPYHCRGTDLDQFKRLVGDDAKVEVRIRNWYP